MINYLRNTFALGWRIGIWRLKLQFKRKFWNKRKRPWCWIVGHTPYDSNSWGYEMTKCSRCAKTLMYKPREYTAIKHVED